MIKSPVTIAARLTVNGRTETLCVAPDTPLLTVLRNDLGLNGPKYGCGLGQCGACMVLIGDKPARSCVIPVHGAQGACIVTLEGLGTREAPHPVQQAFIDAQAAQCGYCLNGMIVSTVALLRRTPQPTDTQVRDALSHNLCRCGTHIEILAAVQLAAERMLNAEMWHAKMWGAREGGAIEDAPSVVDRSSAHP